MTVSLTPCVLRRTTGVTRLLCVSLLRVLAFSSLRLRPEHTYTPGSFELRNKPLCGFASRSGDRKPLKDMPHSAAERHLPKPCDQRSATEYKRVSSVRIDAFFETLLLLALGDGLSCRA